jgi:outer membrane protein assembly factor BamB
MHSRSVVRSSLAVLFSILPFASAQEWTRFRGPNGSGIGKADLPDTLTEKNIQWRSTLPGTGHSSPVVWGDRLFVNCTPDGPGPADSARRIVVCLDAKDGKILWQREFATGAYRKHSDNSFASPSCTVDEKHVYSWFAGPDGSQLVALAQNDGKEVWKRDLGAFTSQHGPGASPVAEKGVVYLQSSQDGEGSFLQAFDAATGKTLWKKDLKGGQHAISTPCLLSAPAGAQLISLSTDNGLIGFEPATGRKLWEMPDIFKLRCVASPVLTHEGLIVVQCGQGQAASEIQVIKGAPDLKPEKAYDIVRIGGYVPTPIAVGDLLFLWKENGTVTCIRSGSKEELWSERVEGPYYASPICIGGKGGRLYNVTRGGDLVVLAADEKFRLIQRFPLGEKNSYATPAVSGGKLFVRTHSQVFCIGGK